MNHLIVSLVAANPDVILTTINPDFLAGTVSKFLVCIPKNLISAMSAFVVSLSFDFVGDFLWHIFYLSPLSILSNASRLPIASFTGL